MNWFRRRVIRWLLNDAVFRATIIDMVRDAQRRRLF